MKIPMLYCRALGIYVVTAALSGCGGSQPPIGTPAAMSDIGSAVNARGKSTTYHETFHYVGHKQAFIVPDGVTQLHVVAVGGVGAVANKSANFPGAYPGRVSAVVRVTPQETLYVFVGGNASASSGGFNGGGRGASVSQLYYPSYDSYGGGGASDVREAGAGLRHRILVAAGGGGQGGFDTDQGANWGDGGWGGGKTGGAGEKGGCSLRRCLRNDYDEQAGGGGGGGGQAYGGSGGSYGPGNPSGFPGENGSLGKGGAGGFCSPSSSYCDTGGYGGGGGGGYYGGGGGGSGGYTDSSYIGGGGGGGGGSSYVERKALEFRIYHKWKASNGIVVFSWQ